MKNSYREKVLAPIAGSSLVGDLLSDDDEFEFVSTQMMKVGSLAHNEIPWYEVEEKILYLLEVKTKDVRLIGYLLQCLQHKTTPERLLLSFQVLTDFIQAYWFECYPNAAKSRFFIQIMQRTEKAVRGLTNDQRAAMSRENMMSAFSDLLAAVKSKKLPFELVESTMSSWAIKHVEIEKQVKQTQHAAVSAAPVEKVLEVDLIASNEKGKRESLLKVAEYLWNETEDKRLSCRLRRHAIWGAITSLPDNDTKGETLLFPVAAERIRDYQADLDQNPSVDLWKRIEYSLSLSPFWLDGHYLSSQLAKKLRQPHSARAIQEETQYFVTRLVGILDCKFQGGQPYVSDATRKWLTLEPVEFGAGSADGNWEHQRQKALLEAEQKGLNVALGTLNEGLAQAKEPREQFYWRLLAAELLEKQGLSALAKQEYKTLLKQTDNMQLQDWEPSLLHRLKQLANEE